MASINEGDDNISSNTDRKDFGQYISIFPFAELKNKWLQGFMFEFGAWFCNIDQRGSTANSIVSNGCAQLQIGITVTRPGSRYLTPAPTPSVRDWLLCFRPASLGDRSLSASCHGAFMQAHDGGFGNPPPKFYVRNRQEAWA
jgi:hypothetical protein